MIKTKMKDHNCGELNLNNLNEEVTLFRLGFNNS